VRQTRAHDPLAGDVVEVQQERRALLVDRRRGVLGREKRLRRLVVGPPRRHADELALGPAQRRQPPAEDAARVDVDRVVDPLRLGDRRVAVDDGRGGAVLVGPGVAHGQAVLVGLAGRLAVQREVAHARRRAALVGLLHARVRDDEPAVVEHGMADEALEEVADLVAKLRLLPVELLERLPQPVRDLHVATLELAHKLCVVVAGQADRGAGGGHRHDEPQHARRVRPAIAVVADEDRPAAVGRRHKLTVDGVAELAEQGDELVAAAVDVADDVERPVLGAAV